MEFLEINNDNHCSKITDETNKRMYGEVKTDLNIIETYFLRMLPQEVFKNKNLKWLDPGSGTGNFSISIYKILMFSLEEEIINIQERKKYIIENMIYMVEINPENTKILKEIFGEKANIYNTDFLTYNSDFKFDIIIGNPPFNNNGLKKVPTNNKNSKLNDGNTVWTEFVKHSLTLLREDGYLSMIVPAIWMKPDKAKMYDLLTSFKILEMKSFTNTQTNRIFNGEAQTPTSIFLLKKTKSDKIIKIYDENDSIFEYYLNKDNPIPIMGVSIVNKLQRFTNMIGYINVIKSNLPPKHIEIFEKKKDQSNYQNITTCILNQNEPKMIYNYSFVPCPYYKKPKLVLAHGMYGFPFLDKNGEYGISNRDNYVITNYSAEKLEIMRQFLSTKFALFIFETTRYRMKYLEKFAFENLPDPTKLPNFHVPINDVSIASYFKLTALERDAVLGIHKKNFDLFDVSDPE